MDSQMRTCTHAHIQAIILFLGDNKSKQLVALASFLDKSFIDLNFLQCIVLSLGDQCKSDPTICKLRLVLYVISTCMCTQDICSHFFISQQPKGTFKPLIPEAPSRYKRPDLRLLLSHSTTCSSERRGLIV